MNSRMENTLIKVTLFSKLSIIIKMKVKNTLIYSVKFFKNKIKLNYY